MKRTALLAALVLTALPAAAKDKIVMKFGTLAPDNTPWSRLLQNFEKKVEKETDKAIDIKLYLNGAKGDERAMLEKMAHHKLDGGGFSTGGMASAVKELQIFELPFLFQNNAESDYIMDEVLFEDMSKLLAEKGLYLYIWAENGWLDFGSKTKAIHMPEDCKGLKMFRQESDVQGFFYESLGAQAVPIPVPEVLTSLQSGLVEAFSSSPIYATGAQWFTQIKYWLDSDHIYQPAAVVFDLDTWNKVTPEQKKIFESVRIELRDNARKDVRGIDEQQFDGYRKAGITVDRITPEQRAAFDAKTRSVHQTMIDKGVISQAMYDKVAKALEAYRAAHPE